MKNLIQNWRRFTISEGKDLNWSAKCMIFDDAGRVMLVQVADGGTWDLPGGHGQNSETPIDAVKREVFEEVGLKIDQIEKIGPVKAEVLRYVFAAFKFSGTFDLQLTEVSDYMWVPVDDLITEAQNYPRKFENTVTLAIKNYTDEIRKLSERADKIKYYEENPMFNPADKYRKVGSSFGEDQ